MVGCLEVSNLEVEIVHAEVVHHAKGDREGDPTQGVGCFSKDDVLERLVACREFVEVELYLPQVLSEDDVESAPPMIECLGEQGPLHHRLDDKWV
jgi:hypothetical protein